MDKQDHYHEESCIRKSTSRTGNKEKGRHKLGIFINGRITKKSHIIKKSIDIMIIISICFERITPYHFCHEIHLLLQSLQKSFRFHSFKRSNCALQLSAMRLKNRFENSSKSIDICCNADTNQTNSKKQNYFYSCSINRNQITATEK